MKESGHAAVGATNLFLAGIRSYPKFLVVVHRRYLCLILNHERAVTPVKCRPFRLANADMLRESLSVLADSHFEERSPDENHGDQQENRRQYPGQGRSVL